jgi:hypothetical protein
MAQIQKGDTFADGQQVTASRLNQFLDSATVLPNIITDQTNLTANTVATGDSILLYDLSATALREATASDLLNSNIPITTPSVTAGTGSDITLSPQNGTIVTTVSYVGTTTSNTVTSNAHGLTAGQVILISSATGSQYNGTYRIASVTTNTFTYNLETTVTAGSGTLSYTKQGSVRNIEHEVINGNIYVDGNAVITGTTVQTGSVTQNGAVTQNGNVTQNGTVTQSGSVTQSGTVNVTGTFQTKGTTAFLLYSNVGTTFSSGISNWVNSNNDGSAGALVRITYSSNWYLTQGYLHGTDDITVPTGETWEITYNFFWSRNTDDPSVFAVTINDSPTHISSSSQISGVHWNQLPASISTVLTAGTYVIKFKSALIGGNGSDATYCDPWNFGSKNVKKYKTA